MSARLDRRAFAGGAVLLAAMSGGGPGFAAAPWRAEDVLLRPVAAADADAIARMIAADYDGEAARTSSLAAVNRALHMPGATRPGWHRTIVAERAGEAIGVASGLRSPLHPAARIHVIVDGRHRRRGTGTRLFDAIAGQVRAEKLQVMATIIGTERTAWPFARACGMHVLMHARQIRVDPASWAVDQWARAVLAQASDFRLASGASVPPERLYAAIGDAYYEMHRRWIETVRMEPPQARSLWGGKIQPAHAALALRGETVIGAAALIAAGDGRATLFPAAACVPVPDAGAERRLAGALIADRLIAAHEAGFTEVLIESDDDDGRMLALMGSIPATGLIEIFSLTMDVPGHWPRPPA